MKSNVMHLGRYKEPLLAPLTCHSREGGNPDRAACVQIQLDSKGNVSVWVPALAGMTGN